MLGTAVVLMGNQEEDTPCLLFVLTGKWRFQEVRDMPSAPHPSSKQLSKSGLLCPADHSQLKATQEKRSRCHWACPEAERKGASWKT